MGWDNPLFCTLSSPLLRRLCIYTILQQIVNCPLIYYLDSYSRIVTFNTTQFEGEMIVRQNLRYSRRSVWNTGDLPSFL